MEKTYVHKVFVDFSKMLFVLILVRIDIKTHKKNT